MRSMLSMHLVCSIFLFLFDVVVDIFLLLFYDVDLLVELIVVDGKLPDVDLHV